MRHRYKLLLRILAAGAAMGMTALPMAVGQIPAVPSIPGSFPNFVRDPAIASLAPLRARVEKLVADGTALNQRCARFKRGSPLEASCRADLSTWQAERGAVQRLADTQKAQVDVLADLVAEYQDLTGQINGNLARINELGAHHREQDFEDWVNLASGAQDEFTAEVKKELTELTVAQMQKGILASVNGLSPSAEEKMIQTLDTIHPRPTVVIAAVRRMATNETRERLAEDAEVVVEYIERNHAIWSAQTAEEMGDATLDFMCSAAPGGAEALEKQCKLFAGEAKILSAELYYGATAVVAKQQVASLINLSEEQLKAVAARTQVLVGQVRERKEVRGRIDAILKQMQENNSEP